MTSLPQITKICSVCKIEKPRELFGNRKTGNGISYLCKKCMCEKNKLYRSKPEWKEKHRLEMIEWRKNNPERLIEIRRRSWIKNGEKENEKKRIKLKEDIEYAQKVRERGKKYNSSGRRKELYHANPNKDEILKNKWIKLKNNPQRMNSRKKYSEKYRKEVLLKKEREGRENLNDNYVIQTIKKQSDQHLKTEEIPKELIEIKRTIIKIKRIINQSKNK